jgi:RNA polymerase sigma-70 factor (ECF subfamily)
MEAEEPTTEIVRRLQKGDPQAAEKLFARFSQRLTRLAERHISRKVAVRVDGEDVVQSVFRTFFRRGARGEFRIDGSNQLWRLLVKITLLKARAKGRYHSAARRDVRAEADPGDDGWWREAVAHEPGPEDAAMLVDQLEALLRGQPELFRDVLERRLQGRPVAEIATELGASRQSVYRVLDVLKKRLEDSAAKSVR